MLHISSLLNLISESSVNNGTRSNVIEVFYGNANLYSDCLRLHPTGWLVYQSALSLPDGQASVTWV